MKTTFFFLLFFGISNSLSAQFYSIKRLGNKYSKSDIETAFSTFDFCGYIFESNRNVIQFDDSSEVEIASKNEFFELGRIISSDCIKDPQNLVSKREIWHVKQGYLIREIIPLNSKN